MPENRLYLVFLLLLLLSLVGCNLNQDSEAVIVIETFDPQTYSENDTYLTLYDSGDNLINEDDDGNPDQANHKGCSRIIVTGGLANGTYYIKVHNPNPTGSSNPFYAIRVLDSINDSYPTVTLPTPPYEDETSVYIDHDAAQNRTTPVSIDLGDILIRTIYPVDTTPPDVDDVDWFELLIP